MADGKTANGAFVVTRKIPLDVPVERLRSIAGLLEARPGVAYAQVDAGAGLKLRYDAALVGFCDIERLLDESGAKRPASLWWRIKSEWFRFTDDNARSNAHATHACCSRPPVAPGNPGKK